MKQEMHFCGKCQKMSLHNICRERQDLSVLEKDIASCIECGNITEFYPPNNIDGVEKKIYITT